MRTKIEVGNDWVEVGTSACIIEIVNIQSGNVLLINEAQDNDTAMRRDKVGDQVLQLKDVSTYCRALNVTQKGTISIIVDEG